jgi:hypothetical protein
MPCIPSFQQSQACGKGYIEKRVATDSAFPSVVFSLDAKPAVNGGGNDGARLGAERCSAGVLTRGWSFYI